MFYIKLYALLDMPVHQFGARGRNRTGTPRGAGF